MLNPLSRNTGGREGPYTWRGHPIQKVFLSPTLLKENPSNIGYLFDWNAGPAVVEKTQKGLCKKEEGCHLVTGLATDTKSVAEGNCHAESLRHTERQVGRKDPNQLGGERKTGTDGFPDGITWGGGEKV